jgi:ligand-binding sensor domain-containing protein/signal transduction histidine kinase
MNQIKNSISLILWLVLPWFCLLFWTGSAAAQEVSQKPDLKFQRIYEGLLSNKISAIYQDSFGYMWIGTFSGLHRYNGIEFAVYTDSDDPRSINGNLIGTIYEDRNKNLWIGTESGINRYQRKKNNFEHFILPSDKLNHKSEQNYVEFIVEDKQGVLWATVEGGKLFYFDEQDQQFKAYEHFTDKPVSSIEVGKANILWIGTLEDGLFKLNTKTARIEASFTHDASDSSTILSNGIHQIEKDAYGNIWVGNRGLGLDRMVQQGGKTEFRHYKHQAGNPNSLYNNEIFSIYTDRSGKLWVGNENGGLHLYNRKDDSFFHYGSDANDPNSLSHNSIWTMYEDDQGRLWVGTGLAGLNVADSYASKFTHFQKSSLQEKGLNNNIIRDFIETDEGNIWIATDGGGLNYFNRQKKTFIPFKQNPDNPYSIGSNAVIDLSRDDNGNIWAGTWSGGASVLTDEKSGRFLSFQEKWDNYQYPMKNIFDIHFDKQFKEYIWIAAFGEALYRYNKKSGKIAVFDSQPDDSQSITTRYILRIFEDSSNNLWIATNNGLNLLRSDQKENGRFERFVYSAHDSTSIPGNSILQVYEDSRKNIWVATSEGLAKYKEETGGFTTYNASDGLPSDEIRSIVEDDSGYLWIGTLKGLSKFDPQKITSKNYDKSDGLQGNEFSRYATYKLSSGELLFGGLNGFNLFHPDSIKSNPNVPPVYLSNFKLFNKPVSVDTKNSPLKENIAVADTILLDHNQSVFTFEFVALNYTNSEQNTYAFKMGGFEEKWNYVGTRRNATYTNLNPGEYIFRVKAANNDGIWNTKGASVRVIIRPPFWQTTWFYLLSAMMIAGLIFGGYRYRVRKMRAHNKQLEQKVCSRTFELHDKNKDLKQALKELKDTKDQLVEKAHKAGMADIASGVLHNVGNLLNSINTSSMLIDNTVKHSKVTGFIKANNLLRSHIGNFKQFIAEDPKGEKLLQYYLQLEGPLKKEQAKLMKQSERLAEKTYLIKEVIAAQQNYAGAKMDAEEIALVEIVEDALSLQAGSIDRHDITIRKEYRSAEAVMVQRSKLVHVLINLFKNAKEAMAGKAADDKIITIKIRESDEAVILSITDSGIGIGAEDLSKIFTYGFTTKKNGHGFGLHSSANYMTEMGGKIEVHSDGVRQGTTFRLIFPRKKDDRAHSQKPLAHASN